MTVDKNYLHEALRLQLAAIKQHFIHILILEARGDKERPRSDYAAWLSSWSESREPTYVSRNSLSDEQSSWLDRLFANLMIVIDQVSRRPHGTAWIVCHKKSF